MLTRKQIHNQGRICGKGVDLGLFPSNSFESQSYEFIEIAHIGPYYGVENDCRKFRSNRMDSFWENRKKSKNGCFFTIFGLILTMFLTFQSYDFDAFAHAEAPLSVEWLHVFMKIVWTVFEKFEIFMKGREKKNKKNDTIA